MQQLRTDRRPDVERDLETHELPLLPGATLDRWLAHSWDRGVQIDELHDLQMLRVRTRNTTYEVAVVAGAPGDVLVRGGRHFPDWTRVHLAGATLGGGFLKRFGVHVGLRMEFSWAGRRVVTSPVHSIGTLSAPPGSVPS
jgi:hypothetical protein